MSDSIFDIILDGEKNQFKNARGFTPEATDWNGVVYKPVRGEAKDSGARFNPYVGHGMNEFSKLQDNKLYSDKDSNDRVSSVNDVKSGIGSSIGDKRQGQASSSRHTIKKQQSWSTAKVVVGNLRHKSHFLAEHIERSSSLRLGYEEHKAGFGKWAIRAETSGDQMGGTPSPYNQGPLMTISNKGPKPEDIVDMRIIPKREERKKPEMGIWGISNLKRKVAAIRKQPKRIQDGIARDSLKSWNRQRSRNDSHDFGMSFCLDKTMGFEGIQEKPESESQNGDNSLNEGRSPREDNQGHARSSQDSVAQDVSDQNFNFSECSSRVGQETRDPKAKSRNSLPAGPREIPG